MHSFFAEEVDFANIGLQKSDVVFYASTDSTNTRAREAHLNFPSGAPKLFVAEEQTAGKGTRGRSFESRLGGLYFSLLFTPPSESYDPSRITPLAAAAVYSALYKLLGRKKSKNLFIKWVNDLYVENKKIAGILSERVTAEGKTGYIIGIGINLFGSDFSPEVSKIAASVETATGVRLHGEKVLYEILKRLMPALSSPDKTKLCRVYRRHSLKRGRKINVTDSHGNTREATVRGLTSDFHLSVKYAGGETAELISGDVSIKFR